MKPKTETAERAVKDATAGEHLPASVDHRPDVAMQPRAKIESDGGELYVTLSGQRVAKRGHKGTPQAGTWISLEPGYVVLDGPGKRSLVIEHNGVRLQ
jgi:hypothetical protein